MERTRSRSREERPYCASGRRIFEPQFGTTSAWGSKLWAEVELPRLPRHKRTRRSVLGWPRETTRPIRAAPGKPLGKKRTARAQRTIRSLKRSSVSRGPRSARTLRALSASPRRRTDTQVSRLDAEGRDYAARDVTAPLTWTGYPVLAYGRGPFAPAVQPGGVGVVH